MNKNKINKTGTKDKIPNKTDQRKSPSAAVSQLLVVLVFTVLAASVFLLPSIFRYYLEYYKRPEQLFLPTMICLYTALLPAFIADTGLFFLLRRISEGNVFCSENVRSLRIISWCCYAECIIFIIFGCYFLISFAISFACAFMGTILRVVKNSFEEAVELKHENDFTI